MKLCADNLIEAQEKLTAQEFALVAKVVVRVDELKPAWRIGQCWRATRAPRSGRIATIVAEVISRAIRKAAATAAALDKRRISDG